MPGESAEKLWKANESALKSTKKHMEQGRGSTATMIKLIRCLQTKGTVADEGKENYLKYDGQKSWKMRAVSLIHFMLCYYNDNNSEVVDAAFKACSEAWPLMDFVESSDTEANLASLSADKEFNKLEKIRNKKHNMEDRNEMKQNIKSKFKIKSIESATKLTVRNRIRQDTKSGISKGKKNAKRDRMMAVANLSLKETYKLIQSKAIDLHSVNAIHTLGYLVANVIVHCLENELNKALTEKCSKWAVDGEEQKIYHAASIAGKAMAVSDLFQTSQGNNAVPSGDVAEGEGNNALVAADGKEENSCRIPEAVAALHEDLEDAEDEVESGGDNEDLQEAEDDAESGADNNC